MVTALAGIMALSMCACGETEETSSTASKTETTTEAVTEAPTEAPTEAETTEEPTEEETEAAEYTFDNGLYKCQTFNICVPDGWVLISKNCSEDEIRIAKTDSEENFDSFNNAVMNIRVPGYRSGSKDNEYDTIEHAVNNDKQFFSGEPEIEDYSFVDYTGKKLSGDSFAYTNGKSVYYVAQLWNEDETRYSELSMDITYYSDEDLAEAETAIKETLELKVEEP